MECHRIGGSCVPLAPAVCQGIACTVSQLVTIDLSSRPVKISRINHSTGLIFWRKYEDLVERCALGDAGVGGGNAGAQALYGSLRRQRHRRNRRGASRRDGHHHAARDEPDARRRDERDRRLQRAEPAARHLSGRRQAARVSRHTPRATSPSARGSTSASTRD